MNRSIQEMAFFKVLEDLRDHYILRFIPNPASLLRDISKFKHRPECKIARQNVDRFFSNRLSEGVLLVADEFGPDARMKDIREHILNTFQALRTALY